MRQCLNGGAIGWNGKSKRGYPVALVPTAVLSLFLILSAAGEDIYSMFRENYAGQGYVVSAEDEGQHLQIKVIGQVPTPNRTVAIIRAKSDLWIATGRLLSKDVVASRTQQVERVAGTRPPKAGDVVFFAPRAAVAGEASA